MSEQPTFSFAAATDDVGLSGRYIVTFREDATTEGIAALESRAAVRGLPSAADFDESALDMAQALDAGGAVFPTLGIAVVTLDPDALNSLSTGRGLGGDDAILAIEPERMCYALAENGGLSIAYLRGYRDATNHLYEQAVAAPGEDGEAEVAVTYADDARSTWGLKATGVVNSSYTGSGIKVAVLDTGMDLNHPDFRGRNMVTRSFVSGEQVQDGHGHGTHCIGTACGNTNGNGRRYGIAHQATIYVGKVLGNNGSGPTSQILAGMEWAVTNGCQVISMSLGNDATTASTAYERMGSRALSSNCLIVAAAGNHRIDPRPGPNPMGQPANSPSIMAVAAVDNRLRLASFSCTSGSGNGANVDIAAPGVAVYSSTKLSQRYATWNGTSMATPHVAGIAALYAQAAAGNRGARLWQVLTSRALRLSLPATDVGAGLVQAP